MIFPSVDALDEFKLQTSTYSAEFGRSLGGVVNLQVKSGANQLRGGAFGFLRDDALDANNFFNNRAGIARPRSASTSSAERWAARSGRTGPSSSRTTRGRGSSRA